MSQPESKPLRRYVRQGILKSVRAGKKVVGKSPAVKRVVRNLLIDNLDLSHQENSSYRYQRWTARHLPDGIELLREHQESQDFDYRPLISILTPTYNTDLQHLKECIDSLKAQSYENWELCIVDDASPHEAVRNAIKAQADADPRIHYHFRKTNGHISAASNDALKLAKGEFIGLLDHDDVLLPNALYEVVKLLNEDRKVDFFYSDEDKIENDRQLHENPFFKPDWNPEFLESVNYITHFAVLRTTLVKKVGGFRGEYNGAQDWDLFLRMSQATKHIRHIPKILYSWRMSETSTASSTEAKPYVVEAQKKALQESLKSRGTGQAQVITGMSKDYWHVRYPVKDKPLVSIVIPTKNQAAILRRCVNSILHKTTYKKYEIILVDTGSTDQALRRWYKRLASKHSNIKVLDWPEQPFSYARSCNYGVSQAKGEYIILLNNDTEVLTTDWIELLLSDAQRDDVGAVGCKLYFPDKIHIQHAGIGLGFGGIAANSLSHVPANHMTPLQHLYANTRHEVSAVTAACLMVKKSRFDEVNGFDEKFRVTYNDVDLCLRLAEAGYRSIYDPMVELVHHESISVGLPEEKRKRDTKEIKTATALFKQRWHDIIANDPHLNPNIERTNASFEVSNK